MASYQALYRKWRPMTFDDVVGQNQVSVTLKSAVENNRIAHAYLFCGTRGTGKTSTAKIFSRAVNCENHEGGEPCNQCPTCKGILDGSILDVYEMDAASNRGVENIRDIRDEVIYTPTGCKYKVYIIDEVHMLTDTAFNALLKTLEEPPSHAIFILATTEPHKIPATVLSRCQRFDFKRISVDEIASRILKITDAEGMDITPDAAELIAEIGDGSMRDAISVLDRCAALGEGKLDTDKVSEITGMVGINHLFKIAEAVAEGSSKDALVLADEIMKNGREPQNLLESLTEHFRALMICKATKAPAELLEKTEQTALRFSTQAEKYSLDTLLYCIKIFGEYLSQSKWMSNPKIAVEMAVIKVCNPEFSTDADALLSRIEKLESKLSGMSNVPTAKAEAIRSTDDLPPWDMDDTPNNAEVPAPKPVVETKAGQGEGGSWEYWRDALDEIKTKSKTLFGFLYIADAKINGAAIEIEVGSQIAYDKIATPGGIEYLSELFTRIGGTPLKAKIYIKGEKREENENAGFSINDLAAKKDMFGTKIDIVD